MWTTFGQAVSVKLGPVLGRATSSAAIFEDEGEKHALLLRMGTGPTAWAYLDTLARAARMSRKALRPKLEALEQEGTGTRGACRLERGAGRLEVSTNGRRASRQGWIRPRRIA
jgi:hypothetical protein